MLPERHDRFAIATAPRPWDARACAALLLAAWLCFPVLFARDVEGFSAQTQSLALLLARDGGVARHDLALPLVSQFLFVSRSGVIDLLALLDRLGITGDAGYRLLTIASFALLVAASSRFAARWGSARGCMALLVLVAMPGTAALGGAFNDNLVSAALVAAALACPDRRGGLARFVAAGALQAAAMQCRLDAALALPFFAGLALCQRPALAHAARAGAAFGAGLVPVAAALGWANGFSPLGALAISRLFAPAAGPLAGLAPAAFFFGLLAPLPILIGARTMAGETAAPRTTSPSSSPRGRGSMRPAFAAAPQGQPQGIPACAGMTANGANETRAPHAWRRVTFLLYPALLLAYAIHAATVMRYFFPLLLPVCALHGGAGLARIAADLRGRRVAGALVGGAALLLVAAPPLVVRLGDGPVLLGGSAWQPLYWRRWQAAQAESLARVDALVAAIGARPAAIVTTHWNDEFYVRLRLFEAGWRSTPAPAACRGLSVYARGAARVVHIRLEPQYGRAFYRPETAALMLAAAGRCPLARALPGAWVTGFGPGADARTGEPAFADARFAQPLTAPLGGAAMPLLGVGWLPRATLAAAAARGDAMLAARAGVLGTQGAMLDRYERNYRAMPLGRRGNAP